MKTKTYGEGHMAVKATIFAKSSFDIADKDTKASDKKDSTDATHSFRKHTSSHHCHRLFSIW